MRNLILILSILMFITSCKRVNEGPTTKVFDPFYNLGIKNNHKSISKIDYKPEEMTQIQFENENFDFGNIRKSAGKVHHFYKFQNTGKLPLTINVIPGCGCTAGKYTKDPIAPGAVDSVELIFNPSTFSGPVNKSARVQGNFPEDVHLHFKANITN